MKNAKKEINDLREEVRILQQTVMKLRNAMELFDLFQQDDEVGVALANVESGLDMVQYKALTCCIDTPTAKKVAERLDRRVAELDALDAEPEFDSAGFSIADRFEDTEEDTHHCDDPGCNCSI